MQREQLQNRLLWQVHHLAVDDKSIVQGGSGRNTGDAANTGVYKARKRASMAEGISRQTPVRAHFLVPRRTHRGISQTKTLQAETQREQLQNQLLTMV